MKRSFILLSVLGMLAAVQLGGPGGHQSASATPVREQDVFDRVVTVGSLSAPSAPSAQVAESTPVEYPSLPGGITPVANSVDRTIPSSAQATQTSPPPPSLLVNMDGLDNNANGVVGTALMSVPDPQVAIGSAYIVEMVNHVGRIYNKTTLSTVSTFRLSDFFNVLTPRCWEGGTQPCWLEDDPSLRYDAISGRWIAAYFSYINKPPGQLDLARLHIAVSQTGDPTGSWYLYYHPYTVSAPHQPWIGITDDKITIADNLFNVDGGWVGEQTRVYNKAEALSGGNPLWVAVFPTRPEYFQLRPAHTLDSMSDQIAAHVSGNSLRIFRYTGVPGQGEVTEMITTLGITGHSPPPTVPNPGGTIQAGGGELDDAFVHVGYLWVTSGTGCRPPGDNATRSCAQVIQVNIGNMSLIQNIVFGAKNDYYFRPAARTDFGGALYVVFGRSNATTYPEARVTGRRPSDPLNTLSNSVLLRSGQVTASGRWGDYFGAARDPTGAQTCVWVVAQYAKDVTGVMAPYDWGTGIGKATYQSC